MGEAAIWAHGKKTDRPIDPRRTSTTPGAYLRGKSASPETDARPNFAEGRPGSGGTRLDRQEDRGGVGGGRRHRVASAQAVCRGAVSYTHLRAHETGRT